MTCRDRADGAKKLRKCQKAGEKAGHALPSVGAAASPRRACALLSEAFCTVRGPHALRTADDAGSMTLSSRTWSRSASDHAADARSRAQRGRVVTALERCMAYEARKQPPAESVTFERVCVRTKPRETRCMLHARDRNTVCVLEGKVGPKTCQKKPASTRSLVPAVDAPRRRLRPPRCSPRATIFCSTALP